MNSYMCNAVSMLISSRSPVSFVVVVRTGIWPNTGSERQPKNSPHMFRCSCSFCLAPSSPVCSMMDLYATPNSDDNCFGVRFTVSLLTSPRHSFSEGNESRYTHNDSRTVARMSGLCRRMNVCLLDIYHSVKKGYRRRRIHHLHCPDPAVDSSAPAWIPWASSRSPTHTICRRVIPSRRD